MKITVVVPTYNRSALLACTIASIAEQTRPPTDIVVVDNGSTDDTEAVVRKLATRLKRLRYFAEPRLGVSRARNRGACEASGELVAFLDDDSVAAPWWLATIADAACHSPTAAAVAGPIALRWTRPAPGWTGRLESWYGQFDLGDDAQQIEYPRYPFASNVALRREAFLSVGGFPVELGPRGERRIANEEDGLFRRVAEREWSVVYAPRALVHHWVHPERISRRYLLRRGVTQGMSSVMADALFAPSRTRAERARRSVGAVGDVFSAGRIALTGHRSGSGMPALMDASMSLGSAVRDAGLALAVRRPPRPSPARAVRTLGLTPEERTSFDRDGFVRIKHAFDGAATMADRIWAFLSRRGIARNDPTSWPSGDIRHLQKLLRDPVFMPIGGPVTSAAIDSLLGAGRWTRPDHWGELLVTFPEPHRDWTIPTLWHTDASYTEPLEPLLGVTVFSFLNRVGRRSGCTLALAGSHRLVARFVGERSNLAGEKSATTRKAFYQSHPWLADLLVPGDDIDRGDRLSVGADIDGLPARVVELTGDPGDVVIAHPLLAHCVSPNGARQPRFMRVIRPRTTMVGAAQS